MTLTFAQYLKAITKGTTVGSSFPSVVKWFVVRQAFSFPALTLQIRPLKSKKETKDLEGFLRTPIGQITPHRTV